MVAEELLENLRPEAVAEETKKKGRPAPAPASSMPSPQPQGLEEGEA